MIWGLVAFLAGGLLLFYLFNQLMGYQKNNIIIDLDERYFNWSKHIEATKEELQKREKEVSYLGNGEFLINDEFYTLIKRNVNIKGIPLQRTILVYDKNKNKKDT